ncbi:hypothetical protein BDV97DRAFT_402102 [Delphinella strobiligena]|nr:hypothetical protein BDV97DRAFT_402102 [Delphinella strobiligena]
MHFTPSTILASLITASIAVSGVSAAVLPREPGTADSFQVVRRQNGIVPSCTATSAQTYTVVSNDTLSKIADKYSLGFCDIAKANNITDPNYIYPGEVLTIPAGVCTPDNTSCAAPPTTLTCTTGGPNAYLVRKNDTMITIANEFNITLDSLAAANPQIADINVIDVNELLNIPVCANTMCVAATYIIKSGDTFYQLAKAWGSTTGQVLASNLALDPYNLAIGQEIILPQKCGASWSDMGGYKA